MQGSALLLEGPDRGVVYEAIALRIPENEHAGGERRPDSRVSLESLECRSELTFLGAEHFGEIPTDFVGGCPFVAYATRFPVGTLVGHERGEVVARAREFVEMTVVGVRAEQLRQGNRVQVLNLPDDVDQLREPIGGERASVEKTSMFDRGVELGRGCGSQLHLLGPPRLGGEAGDVVAEDADLRGGEEPVRGPTLGGRLAAFDPRPLGAGRQGQGDLVEARAERPRGLRAPDVDPAIGASEQAGAPVEARDGRQVGATRVDREPLDTVLARQAQGQSFEIVGERVAKLSRHPQDPGADVVVRDLGVSRDRCGGVGHRRVSVGRGEGARIDASRGGEIQAGALPAVGRRAYHADLWKQPVS